MRYIRFIVFIILGLGAVIGLVIFFPFFIGLSSNYHGSSHGPPFIQDQIAAEVYIPDGAHIQKSDQNFAPQNTTMEIGNNSKVRWINDDIAQSSVVADDKSDLGFFNATHSPGSSDHPTAASSLYPGELFEYTFTNPGTFRYHCSFHSWMHGTVIVLPKLE
jgi:plastocyanin